MWLIEQANHRTVSDAVYVLDAITGFDYNDKATEDASKYIPRGGYKKFLNAYRNPFFTSGTGSLQAKRLWPTLMLSWMSHKVG